MADPVLDEILIQACLALPPTAENSEKVQQGALMAAVNAFDRRLERDKFIDIVSSAQTLKDALGRQSIARSIDIIFRAGDLSQEKLDSAIEGLTKVVDIHRLRLLDMVKDMAQCPTKHDSVN